MQRGGKCKYPKENRSNERIIDFISKVQKYFKYKKYIKGVCDMKKLIYNNSALKDSTNKLIRLIGVNFIDILCALFCRYFGGLAEKYRFGYFGFEQIYEKLDFNSQKLIQMFKNGI